jgi:hypothetical protein
MNKPDEARTSSLQQVAPALAQAAFEQRGQEGD